MNTNNKKTVKFGDYIAVLTDYHANGSYKKLKENVSLLDDPDYAVMIRTTNFEKNDFMTDLKYISKDAYNFLAKSRVFPRDILMNKIANAGSVYFMPDLKRPVSLAMNLFLIRTNEKELSQGYVYYYLKANEQYVKSFAIGTATTTITKTNVRNLEIRKPSIDTQNKIVSILSAYDDLIENNLAQIKILEEMAQMIYREWFVNFHYPGHEKVKMVDSDLGKVPEGWEVVPLGSIVDIRKGKNITKKTITDGPVPVVAGGLTPAYYHNQANTHYPVITVSASGANAGHVNLYQEDIWASDCSFIDEETTPYVYYFYLLLKHRQIEVTRLQRGAAQPHVYPIDLMKLEVTSIPTDFLENFSQMIDPISKLIGNLIFKNNKLRKTRDLLLPKLISGELDVETMEINTEKE